jgi:hypothetical protein
MPDLDILFPGRFLKGKTLDKPKVIRIVSVESMVLDGDDNKKEHKATVKYKSADGDGEWVCNKTNALLIAAMFGRDFATWAGHLIVLAFDPEVRFGAEKPGGIRVFGSPEIARPISAEIKRPRRKTPERYTLHKTDKNGNALDGAPTPGGAA